MGQSMQPEVGLYCIIAVIGCWTDCRWLKHREVQEGSQQAETLLKKFGSEGERSDGE